jgi:hypothetical protein
MVMMIVAGPSRPVLHDPGKGRAVWEIAELGAAIELLTLPIQLPQLVPECLDPLYLLPPRTAGPRRSLA